MEKEEIASLAHLLTAMKDISEKINEAVRKKDVEELSGLKKEALSIQEEIDKQL